MCWSPPTCDVIHHHGGSRVSDVAGDEAPETLLTSRVPELEPDLGGGGGGGAGGGAAREGAGGGDGGWVRRRGRVKSEEEEQEREEG